ncbi:hypothetical protein [uncultured Formosa sp.]|uniref:hypothetical protein n=1 Tax=uncultured Formosa sp. TaxID=255435 RepID=UPI00260D919C|nr:hypothetical protein [uncultured Formosa sp.]
MKKILVIVFFAASFLVNAQKKDGFKRKIEFGTELQLYPAGFMPMLTSNVFLNEKWALRFRVGGNFADRQDFSEYNDDETAQGVGGSLGVVRYVPYGMGHFIAGVSLDTWNMWTDWKDGLNTLNPTSGETYNVVLQPWVNGGYLFNLSRHWNAGASLGFGREINIITRGEKVGEGWIGILALSVNYIFK